MATGKKRFLQRIRVPLGFLFTIAFLYFAKPDALLLGIGIPISIVGLFIRGWAAGHIRKNLEITVSGPYSHTRNPLYLGSLVMCVGVCVGAGIWWLGLIFTMLFLSIYLPVMRVESEDLKQFFPESFPDYEANVPLLIPRITPWKKSEANFDGGLYMKYREYRATLGLIAVWGILGLKMFWFAGS
jgi:protein-S-isoprenylcysteine O-methyltransferase Ste14